MRAGVLKSFVFLINPSFSNSTDTRCFAAKRGLTGWECRKKELKNSSRYSEGGLLISEIHFDIFEALCLVPVEF